jgi:hypothetical protein
MRIFLLSLLLIPVLTFAAATTTKPKTLPAVKCLTITETITFNSTDAKTKNQVSQLQNFLIQRGFLSGTSTGIFNTTSMNALKKYQIKSKIADLGITDSRTRDRIQKDTCSAQHIQELKKKVAKPRGLTPSQSKTATKTLPQEVVVKKTITTTIDKATGKVLGATTTVEQSGKVAGKKVLISTTSTTTKSSQVISKINSSGKIQILSPFAGFSTKAGYPTNITWRASGYAPDTLFKIALANGSEREVQKIPYDMIDESTGIPVPDGMKILTDDASSLNSAYKNSGIYSWSVPNNLPYGSGYRVFIGPADNLEAGVFSEPFTILGTGMMPVIKNIRTTKISAGTYLVNITGENLRDTLSVKYYLNGREVGNSPSYGIKFFGGTQMQYTITEYDMSDMPTGVYYKVTVLDDDQESEPKNIVFW